MNQSDPERLDYAQPPRKAHWEWPQVVVVALIALILLAAAALVFAFELGWTPDISVTN